jgi:HPt (histidine-containing phosphotransfer) domain-containing protein
MENTETFTQTILLSAATDLYDLSMLEEMDDNEYLREILTIFLSEASSDFKEMKVALQQGNLETLCKKAHKLKGGTGVIQAEKLGAMLTEIENIGKKGLVNDGLIGLVEKATQEYKSIEKALQIYIAGIK